MTWSRIAIHCLIAALVGVAPTFAGNDATKVKCLEANSNPDQTIQSCTSIVDDTSEVAAEKFTAYLHRARARVAKQEWESSIVDYNSAIQLRPDVAEPYKERGAAYERKGDRERAISDYSNAIRINPRDAGAYSNRGLTHYKNEAYDLAIADFDEAIRLDPKNSVAYNGRGVAYGKKGDYRKAISDFTEAIRLNGYYANAYHNRGIARANMGEFTQAIADIQAAIRIVENNPNFYNELAWTYFRSGKAAAGLPHADRALRLNPSYAGAYDTRGSIYEALGEHDNAIADFKKALSLDPSIASAAAALRHLAQNDAASVTFSDVVQFVKRQGWRASLGDICAKFELPRGLDNCIFQQLSVQETEGRGDPRGLNVPASADAVPSYVVIFHLTPLVGEFFVVSTDGELLSAFLRFKGTDYNRVSNSDVRDEFNKDIAYWTKNFTRLKKGLEAEQSGWKLKP